MNAPQERGPHRSKTRVYFAQSGHGGAIKIGYSWNTYGRRSNLNTASPVPVRWLGDIPGTPDLERELHRKFAHLRIKGEWFSPAPELIEHIDVLLARGAAADEIALHAAADGARLRFAIPGPGDPSLAAGAGHNN